MANRTKVQPPIRKREARFAATEAERELIAKAAAARDLLPATYMRRVVLSQARLDAQGIV